MICPGGNEAPPLQQAGYWAEKVDPARRIYSVVRCRDRLECPEGPPETCASGRKSVGCGNCEDNHYRARKGRCDRCTDLDASQRCL